MDEYDSTEDTLAHSKRVQELMQPIIDDLIARSFVHDHSKLHPPEKEAFDLRTKRLAELEYGSQAYYDSLKEPGFQAALQHHYAKNDHHPEHGRRGINDMTLMSLVEMLTDWRAATERNKNGSMALSLREQQKRFQINDQLQHILINTARVLGWLSSSQANNLRAEVSHE